MTIDEPITLESEDIVGTVTAQVTTVTFPDGERGVVLLLPEDMGTALPMTCAEAVNLCQAVAQCIKTANEYNVARSHGAVGPTQ